MGMCVRQTEDHDTDKSKSAIGGETQFYDPSSSSAAAACSATPRLAFEAAGAV